MVWSHQSRSDSDEEEEVEEFEADADEYDDDEEERLGPVKTPREGGSVVAANSTSWLERGSESGSSEVRGAPTRAQDEGGEDDVGADDGDSSGEEEEEEGTNTNDSTPSQPPPSSAPSVDVPPPAQEGGQGGGYLGLAGEGDQDTLAFDCDFLLELLRSEEVYNGEGDMGAAAQQPLYHHQQQYLERPQCETDHHGASEWSQPDQGQGRGEADSGTLQQLLESYRGQQPYTQAQAQAQAQTLHDHQLLQAQQEAPSCSPAAGGMVSTTKTLAQLFGLPQPLYLSPSNPSTTLSALEQLSQSRRRSKTREAMVVLPPSLAPFLSQMTAFLAPSSADPQEAVRPPSYSETKRARAEAGDHLAQQHHQRQLLYGGQQLQEDVVSHMEGETGGGHMDSLLTYLDSPMTVSFDASSTPCSTPSSPFSPTNQPQHHLLNDALLRGPATADPHRVAAAGGQPHRPLVEYAREALRNSGILSSTSTQRRNSGSASTSTMTTASPAQAQPTDGDADVDSNFLEEVMQFATQLEQDLLS